MKSEPGPPMTLGNAARQLASGSSCGAGIAAIKSSLILVVRHFEL